MITSTIALGFLGCGVEEPEGEGLTDAARTTPGLDVEHDAATTTRSAPAVARMRGRVMSAPYRAVRGTIRIVVTLPRAARGPQLVPFSSPLDASADHRAWRFRARYAMTPQNPHIAMMRLSPRYSFRRASPAATR